jgi:hypothetical protein
MLQLHAIVAALRDLVPWIPIVIIFVVLSAFGIVLKVPRDRGPFDDSV